MTPLNVSTVTQAVEQMLLSSQNELDVTVVRADVVNEDPGQCPWIGIYRTLFRLPTRTLGAGPGNRQQRVALALLAQQSHPSDAADCEELLEALVQSILATLLGDESLRGNVDTIDEIEVIYQNYSQVDSAFMQTAIIQLVGISNGG